MKIVLIGAPASGKGTQSILIVQNNNIPYIATGDIFRKNIAERTRLGLKAEKNLTEGKLVDDKITNDMIKSRLKESDCKRGWLLDGYPRTIKQAMELDKISEPDIVIFIDVSVDEAIKRNQTRRICKKCNKSFSTNDYRSSTCNVCGGELIIRIDEKEEVFKVRCDLFQTLIQPLVTYYKAKGKLRTVNGNNSMSAVSIEIEKHINSFKKGVK